MAVYSFTRHVKKSVRETDVITKQCLSLGLEITSAVSLARTPAL